MDNFVQIPVALFFPFHLWCIHLPNLKLKKIQLVEYRCDITFLTNQDYKNIPHWLNDFPILKLAKLMTMINCSVLDTYQRSHATLTHTSALFIHLSLKPVGISKENKAVIRLPFPSFYSLYTVRQNHHNKQYSYYMNYQPVRQWTGVAYILYVFRNQNFQKIKSCKHTLYTL